MMWRTLRVLTSTLKTEHDYRQQWPYPYHWNWNLRSNVREFGSWAALAMTSFTSIHEQGHVADK